MIRFYGIKSSYLSIFLNFLDRREYIYGPESKSVRREEIMNSKSGLHGKSFIELILCAATFMGLVLFTSTTRANDDSSSRSGVIQKAIPSKRIHLPEESEDSAELEGNDRKWNLLDERYIPGDKQKHSQLKIWK
jgi:hypothetical protein